MSDRITETELARVISLAEKELSGSPMGGEYGRALAERWARRGDYQQDSPTPAASLAVMVPVLGRELRRLRGMIVALDRPPDYTLRAAGRAVEPLLAEALAIREEGKPTFDEPPVTLVPGQTFGEPRMTFNEGVFGDIKRVWVNGRPFTPEQILTG